MDYQKIYQDFYSRYYDKAELLTKRFFLKHKSKKKTFGDAHNIVTYYLSTDFINKHHLKENKVLTDAHRIFERRYTIYETDQIQEIFANEIKTDFEEYDPSKLPFDYNYIKLVKEIAILEVAKEIRRLLSNNSRLLEMMYQLNDFDDFEIRKYDGISLENTPIFKKLHQIVYPHLYNQDTGLNAITIPTDTEGKNNFLSLFKNQEVYNCFMDYQKHIIDFYTDYSYLKKRLEKEKLIHYHKDNDFMKIIFEQMKLISEKNYNEYFIQGKLKSLEKSYSAQRENNFNIVFDRLL